MIFRSSGSSSNMGHGLLGLQRLRSCPDTTPQRTHNTKRAFHEASVVVAAPDAADDDKHEALFVVGGPAASGSSAAAVEEPHDHGTTVDTPLIQLLTTENLDHWMLPPVTSGGKTLGRKT